MSIEPNVFIKESSKILKMGLKLVVFICKCQYFVVYSKSCIIAVNKYCDMSSTICSYVAIYFTQYILRPISMGQLWYKKKLNILNLQTFRQSGNYLSCTFLINVYFVWLRGCSSISWCYFRPSQTPSPPLWRQMMFSLPPRRDKRLWTDSGSILQN